MSGKLYIISTPIGNLGDISFRAISVLNKSDFILCEDTRRSSKLLFHYNIKQKLISYHKFNEKKLSEKIVALLRQNKVISLISDAGTPVISDPGLLLVKKCIEEKLNICPIPGPSAVTTCMSVSGFGDKYFFYGFLPKKNKEIETILAKLSNFDFPIIFFIPGNKINFYLNYFRTFFSDRSILIAREMTKIYEVFFRKNIDKIEDFKETLKGEVTAAISNKIIRKKIEDKINESVKLQIVKMLKKYSHKDVVDFISKKENLKKKIVYDFCLKIKK